MTDSIKSSNLERHSSCEIVVERLASLFARLTFSKKKYTEPSDVLMALVDDFGHPIALGE
jgi:hypothetical protein